VEKAAKIRRLGKVSLPFASARRGGPIHLRNVVEFEFPPFAPVHPRNVFEFEFLFFGPACRGGPIFSRFHLVQSSRLELGRFVFSPCGLLTLGLGSR